MTAVRQPLNPLDPPEQWRWEPVVPVAEVEAMCDILEHKLPSIAGLEAAAAMLRKLAHLPVQPTEPK